MEKNNQINERLVDEAEAWVVKLRSDNVTQNDKQQFSEWLNRSEDHIKAFDEAYAMWKTLGAVNYIPDVKTMQSEPQGFSFNAFINDKLAFLQQNTYRAGWTFACVLLLCVITINLVDINSAPTATRFETQVGQIQFIELEDGSSVTLNTNSIVDVEFTSEQRSLNLVQGEAYFSVAHNKKRPFVVDFGKGNATAVGTAFNIYRESSHLVAVTVTEGIVDVRETADIATPNPEAKRLHKDQQVKVGRRGIGPSRTIRTEQHIAWRDQTIIFNNTPLVSALEQLSRYLETPVQTNSSDLDQLKVSGTFSLNNPVNTLDALATAFNLTKVASPTNKILYLSSE